MNREKSGVMMRIVSVTLLALCLLLGGTVASAQTVYETRGPNGPVFSDKPQPGAKPVELRPLNVIDNAVLTGGNTEEKGAAQPAPRKARSERPVAEKDVAAPYRSFAIVSPENDGSIVANTAVFEVRVAVEPALRLGDGHAILVSINGKLVGQRFTATEFMIPPEFWGEQLPPPNQRLQLGAMIVDHNGVVLKEAAPVQFQLRYATIFQRPHELNQQPRPMPQKKPERQSKTTEKPQPEPNVTPESRLRSVAP